MRILLGLWSPSTTHSRRVGGRGAEREPPVTCGLKRLGCLHYHGNRELSSPDRGKRRTGAERLRPQPPRQSGDSGSVCDPSPLSPCRERSRVVRAARNFPLLPGDKSTWAGVEEGPLPLRSLASSVSQRIRPLATLLQGSISPWQPRVVGQLSGPRRSLQDPATSSGVSRLRRITMATGGQMLWARADSRRGSQAWPGVPGKGTEGVADRRCGKGSEGREKRAESAGQSRSIFLGMRSGGGKGWQPGCGGRGCERAGTRASAITSRPISPGRTEMGGACLGFGSGRRQGAVVASGARSIPVRKSPSCGVEI